MPLFPILFDERTQHLLLFLGPDALVDIGIEDAASAVVHRSGGTCGQTGADLHPRHPQILSVSVPCCHQPGHRLAVV